MIDQEKLFRNQLIIITLIFVLLAVNLVFIFWDYHQRGFPAGEFKTGINLSECSIEGLKVIGVGDSRESSVKNLLAKQENYAHLYCNGKFKDDPDDAAISGLGCLICKPDCNPSVTNLTETTFIETRDGIISSKTIGIKCPQTPSSSSSR